MINTFLESYKREQASKARDLAYILEDAEDEFIDECVEAATHEILNESVIDDDEETIQEMKELDKQLDHLDMNEAAEIERIMNSDTGITFTQMIGLDPIPEN